MVAYNLLVDPGHKDPNVSKWYDDLFEVPVAESKYIVKNSSEKKGLEKYLDMLQDSRHAKLLFDEIDGAGYIEKYNFSFMPVSGPYQYDKISQKRADGYIVFEKKRELLGKGLRKKKFQ